MFRAVLVFILKKTYFGRINPRISFTTAIYMIVIFMIFILFYGLFLIKSLRTKYLFNKLNLSKILCEEEDGSARTTHFVTDNCKRILRNKIYEFQKQDVDLPTLIHSNTDDLPIDFDARHEWIKCNSIRYIRDQGSCGSCWAVAVASTITDRICIHSKFNISTYVSEEDLLSCCTKCGYGCLGGRSVFAWKFWKDEGIVSGSAFGQQTGCKPYSFPPCIHQRRKNNCSDYESTPLCFKKCIPHYNKSYEQDRSYGKIIYSILSDEKQIMKEIIRNGPVQATMILYDDFVDYKFGIYSPTKKSKKLSNHSVKIIGWGTDTATGVEFWIASNSFNFDWGENGYFRIRRANTCNLQNEVYAGIPKLISNY